MYQKNLKTKAKIIEYIFLDGTSTVFNIDLAAIINKFDNIFTLVNDFLSSNKDLRELYEKFLKEYLESEEKLKTFVKYSDRLIQYIDDEFDKRGLASTINVKVNKSFILNIDDKESIDIFKSSVRTRFFIVCYLSNYSLSDIECKMLHKIVCKEIVMNGVIDKLFTIINSIIMNTYPTRSGKKVWDMLSVTAGYSSDSYAINLMSSMFYKALPSLDPSYNPIAYMISICKNETDWLLRTNFGVKFVNSNINTTSIISSSNHIVENEIYYNSVISELFEHISKLYPEEIIKLKKYNCYMTMLNISNLLMYNFFETPISYITIDNAGLINLYVYDFLKKNDPDKIEMLKILASAPVFDNSCYGKLELPTEYIDYIRDHVDRTFTANGALKFISLVSIRKIIVEGVQFLYKYSYMSIFNRTLVDIDWYRFIDEYLDYIIKAYSGKYPKPVINYKKEGILDVCSSEENV